MTDTTVPINPQLYVQNKGWSWRLQGEQFNIQVCPICNNSNWKFFINRNNGLNDCKVCNWEGNLVKLKAHLGDPLHDDAVPGVVAADRGQQKPASLPDIDAMHAALLQHEDAMEYLTFERGFSEETIKKLKLGVDTVRDGKTWIVYPFFHECHLCYAKWRTLPPLEKDFRGLSGREQPLYNADVITKEMDELFFVEGEADCIAMIDKGVLPTVGVPGANSKKAAWIAQIDKAAPKKMYILFDSDEVGQRGAREMAARIDISKVCNILLPPFEVELPDGTKKPGKDINEWFRAGHTLEEFQVLKDMAKPFDVAGVVGLGGAIQRLILERQGKLPKREGIDTPWPSLNKRMGVCYWGDMVGVLAEGKVGKAGPLDAKILTPTGWTTMGELRLGQAISSIDGAESIVTGIFPQGVKDAYRVTFSDGRSTVCCGEHLWTIGDLRNFTRDGYRTVTTLELKSATERNASWFVPLWNGEALDSGGHLPLDPWLLGAIIGDGALSSKTTPRIAKNDIRFIEHVEDVVGQYGCRFVQVTDGGIDFSLSKSHDMPANQITQALRSLGLMGKRSVEKFLPEVYLTASRDVRLALLRGLMDSDGSVEGRYNVPCFNTSSPQLAKDVQRLVWSLGGTGRITSRITKYTHNGEKREGVRSYRLLLKLHDEAFQYHSVKAAKHRARSRDFRLTVTSVEPVSPREMQCISVSHPSQLYITDDFIVTHNTTLVLNWLEYLVKKGHNTMLYCLEMPTERMAEKWVSHVMQVPNTEEKPLSGESLKAAQELAAAREPELYLGYTSGSNPKEEVFDVIRQAVRRYGIKVVAFDNLQMLSRSEQNAAQELSVLSKKFKALAMELNVLLILIVQPNRVGDNQIVSSRNVMGASAIEKDVDSMLCLHRKRLGLMSQSDFDTMGGVEVEENMAPEMLARVDLSRYAAGGSTTLWFDGETSTVSEMSTDQKAAMPKPQIGNALPVEEEVQVA